MDRQEQQYSGQNTKVSTIRNQGDMAQSKRMESIVTFGSRVVHLRRDDGVARSLCTLHLPT